MIQRLPLFCSVFGLLLACVFTTALQAQQPPQSIQEVSWNYSALYNFRNNSSDPLSPTDLSLVAQAPGSNGSFYSTSPTGGTNNLGTVYGIALDGTLTFLHSFTYTDGANPRSGLMRGSDGSFYGTTLGGGKYWAGTIFKITADGQFTHLFDFRNGAVVPAPVGRQPTDQEKLDAAGSYPISAPVQGKDGNFYGVTSYANNLGSGVLYQISPAGQYKALYLFKGEVGTVASSLVAAADGNLYGTTNWGPAGSPDGYGYGAIFKATTTGAVSLLHKFDLKQGAYPNMLIQGQDGSLYGTTSQGGAGNYGVVYKLALNSSFLVIHEFKGPEGAAPVSGVVQGADGMLYGATKSGGPFAASMGVVYRLNTDGSKFCVLHNFDGPAGAWSSGAIMQHTNGDFYGTTYGGGMDKAGNPQYGGVFYRLANISFTGGNLIPTRSGIEIRTNVNGSGIKQSNGESTSKHDFITIHLNDPTARVVQIIHREVTDASGQVRTGFLNCPPLNKDKRPILDDHCTAYEPNIPNIWKTCNADFSPYNNYPSFCYPLTHSIVDAGKGKPDPYFVGVVPTCDGVILYDRPTFFETGDFTVNGTGIDTSRDTLYFTADDYVIQHGKVAWKIEWTRVKKPGDTPASAWRYEVNFANPDPNDTFLTELKSFLAGNGFTFP